MNNQKNNLVGAPYEKKKNVKHLILINVQNGFQWTPLYLMIIIYLAKILRALLSNKNVDNSVTTELCANLLYNCFKIELFLFHTIQWLNCVVLYLDVKLN